MVRPLEYMYFLYISNTEHILYQTSRQSTINKTRVPYFIYHQHSLQYSTRYIISSPWANNGNLPHPPGITLASPMSKQYEMTCWATQSAFLDFLLAFFHNCVNVLKNTFLRGRDT